MKKIISVFCVLIILVSMCGCAKKLENVEPDGAMASLGGIAVQQGQWIYFINGAMPPYVNDALQDTPVAKIYRMQADGSGLEAVTKLKAHDMYIYKDKIFYTAPTSKQVVLYVINIDGSGNKKLLTFESGEFVAYGTHGAAVGTQNKIYYFNYETLDKKVFETGTTTGIRISDNYIYYFAQNVEGTKRIEISTGNIETLCVENGLLLHATDSEVFFVSARLPYKLDANTKQLTQISEAYYRYTLINMKNRVIICCESEEENNGIYTQPIDNVAGRPVEEGGNVARKLVHPKNAACLCANDDYIFFVEDGTGDIYRMTYQGTEKTVLGNIDSVYRADSMDVVNNVLIIFDNAESGNAYYVPIDGSGKLTVIKEQ